LAEAEERFWDAMGQVVPGSVRLHLGNARREFLLAIRATIDSAIERADGGGAAPRRPKRVKVQ
jgi:hypothetical protein